MDGKGDRARVPISDPWPQTIANGGVSLIELISCIYAMTVTSGAVTVILLIIARRVEPKHVRPAEST